MADVSSSPKLKHWFTSSKVEEEGIVKLGSECALTSPYRVFLYRSVCYSHSPSIAFRHLRRKDVVNQCLEFACCIGFSFPQRQLTPRTESVLYAFVCVFISVAASRYSLRLWSLVTPNKHQRRSFLFPFTSAVFRNNSALMLTPLTEWICYLHLFLFSAITLSSHSHA